jgi:hypothetical protein
MLKLDTIAAAGEAGARDFPLGSSLLVQLFMKWPHRKHEPPIPVAPPPPPAPPPVVDPNAPVGPADPTVPILALAYKPTVERKTTTHAHRRTASGRSGSSSFTGPVRRTDAHTTHTHARACTLSPNERCT